MPPTYAACPTEIIEAPIGVVWTLLTDFSNWGSFYDVRVISVEPPGPAVIGQRMVGEAGPRWLHLGVAFEYTVRVEASRSRFRPHHLPVVADTPASRIVRRCASSDRRRRRTFRR
jgi:hypothetical protein